MEKDRNIRITLRPAAGREGKYLAHYASEVLKADFCVYVKDSIFGALALQAFSEMIRKAFGKHYRTGEIDFDLSRDPASFRSRALLDVVLDRRYAATA